MTCIDCMMAETSARLLTAAWSLSSASSLAEAKQVDDPPSLWAGRIMERFHEADHDMDRAVAALAP